MNNMMFDNIVTVNSNVDSFTENSSGGNRDPAKRFTLTRFGNMNDWKRIIVTT